VKSTDQAGNTADSTISFTLDTSTAAATVALTHDTAGAGTPGTSTDHLTSDASLTVSGAESGAAITYSVDGGAFSSSYNPAALADGLHSVDVKSTDQAGNTADSAISFTLDTSTTAASVALTHDTAGAGPTGPPTPRHRGRPHPRHHHRPPDQRRLAHGFRRGERCRHHLFGRRWRLQLEL